ncbi:META domain-containing protein [Cardiobacterium valvarum]|uniref:DUF306 domain-containing protein n=1 Tax=Cardiobacterium valvarum F0432 TaxID=797473 RepID=G9ZIK4_9GAMM|nr:META domain-containing protein [Cardiobacterium valvarum]EHM51966.1 hypothetical protein HMPREF9080_02581 [Cardiobacterium valvarum F0432]
MKSKKILLACVPLLLGACQGGGMDSHDPTVDTSGGMQGQWVLESGQADGKALNTAAGKITLNTANKDAFTGIAAINQYNAPVKIRGNTIEHTGETTTTLMAGDMEVMRLESDYIKALNATKTIRRDGDTLTLSGDGIELRYRPGS